MNAPIRHLSVVTLVLLLFQDGSPPSNPLPPTVDDEIRALVQAGFGDPRQGEYRNVKIQIGSVSGRHGEVETRGWVLPGNQNVVCWNGSTYRVLGLGDPADYKQDVGTNMRPANAATHNRLSEAASLAPRGRAAQALLLILGDTESAAKAASTTNPFATLTETFAWTSFDRALTHLMRGQDEEALEQARIAQRIYPKPNEQAHEFLQNNSLLHETEILDRLVPDLERRAANPVPPFDAAKLPTMDQSTRIAYLIQQLENVQSTQMGQPGGISPASTEPVRALIAEASPAVDPLLNLLEGDTRLTRSVYFPRDFMTLRGIADVKSVAWQAVAQIMGVYSVGLKDGKRSLSEVRRFWQDTKSMTPAQRWGTMLADDAASQAQWSEAINKITEQSYIQSDGGWVTAPGQAKTAADARLKGEDLRGSLDVSGLMDKRIRQMEASVGRSSSSDQFQLADIGWLATRRAVWDANGAVPLLKHMFDKSYELLLLAPGSSADALAASMARLVDWRLRLGDQTAVKDYEALLTKYGLPDGWGSENVLMPFWRHAGNAELDELCHKVLNTPESEWSLRSLCQSRQNGSVLRSLVTSRLYGSAAFRDELLLALDDETLLYTMQREGSKLVERTNTGTNSSHLDLTDPLLPEDGATVPVRRCDFIARSVSLSDFRQFRDYWPLAEKERWLEEFKALIRSEGAALADRARSHDPDPWIRD